MRCDERAGELLVLRRAVGGDRAQDGLIGRAFSASYAPRDRDRAAAFTAELRDLFRRWRQRGVVRMSYTTTVYTARRRELAD